MGRQLMRTRQHGEAMLVTMVVLLLMAIALVYTTRMVASDTAMSGNTLTRQKDVHVADIVLRDLQQTIFSAYNGQPLELIATAQPWYRVVAAGSAGPNEAYWSACANASATAATRCATVIPAISGGAVLPYTALVVVQPTGLGDANACSATQFSATYYDVFIRVIEASGRTSATVETVIKLCSIL